MVSAWQSLRDRVRAAAPPSSPYWYSRYAKPVIFLIIILALAGVYLATTVPISVFPKTDFPRVVIGVENGVMPIDQMMVTITRPIEESVNSVPGLQNVRSITSRGSAEVDLFFDWHVDMVTTLQLVDAALSHIRTDLPATATIQTHRLTFASFPIIGYSLTSDTVPQTELWTMATYDLKPRLNRLDGVAAVVVQGGQEPEFQITPDPAKLLTAGVTVSDMLDAVRRTNLIDSPGLLQQGHELYLGLVTGQVTDSGQIGRIVVKNTPTGIPIQIGDLASIGSGVKPVYTVVTANGHQAVLLNVSRQPDSNTLDVANEVHAEIDRIRKTLPPGIRLE
ncbi:MAG: efflux RND transporter permease subunit, partial [Terriglobales bacterium]